jgi:hypothetical protein
VFQNLKNFWKRIRAAKTDCTGKNDNNPWWLMMRLSLVVFSIPATAAHGDRRRNCELGVSVCWLCWGLDRRRIWKLCVCVCVLVLGSPSSSFSSKQQPTTTTRTRRSLPQVTTRERESQKRGAEASRRTWWLEEEQERKSAAAHLVAPRKGKVVA